jgi:hypothetical protein
LYRRADAFVDPLDQRPIPASAPVLFGLPYVLATSLGILFDDLGLPIVHTFPPLGDVDPSARVHMSDVPMIKPTVVVHATRPCISTLDLTGLPLDEINQLWLNDIRSRIVVSGNIDNNLRELEVITSMM